MGGAQAIAALALGTETIRAGRRDRRPGQPLRRRRPSASSPAASGSTASPGPSDLLVLASAGADPRLVALDLLAQAEHGEDSLVVAVSDDARAARRASAARCRRCSRDRPTVAAGPKVLVDAPDLDAALAFAEALAPEHLQLVGEAAEALAPRVRRAGCLFVGAASGDRVRRLRRGLEPHAADRRRGALRVRPHRRALPPPHGRGARRRRRRRARARRASPIAEAEGFAVHAESMSARIRENR